MNPQSVHFFMWQPMCSQFPAHWIFSIHSSTCSVLLSGSCPWASLVASCRVPSDVSWVAGQGMSCGADRELSPGAVWEVPWVTASFTKEISRSATGDPAGRVVLSLGAGGASCSTSWGGLGLLMPPAPLSDITAPRLNS